MPAPTDERLDPWLAALDARHRGPFRSSEFLKAVRALSARYVERRDELSRRSALDSAGKRAAFAAFYAPLHFVTTVRLIEAIGDRLSPCSRLIDLGCGTGSASAAWALAQPAGATIDGIDRDAWALEEARWNWRQLGVAGRARRGDLVRGLSDTIAHLRGDALHGTGILAAWSVNELESSVRTALLPLLLRSIGLGATILVIEPIARKAVPWWRQWAPAFERAGGRADEWTLAGDLPPALATIDEAAGFHREALKARTLIASRRSGSRATIAS